MEREKESVCEKGGREIEIDRERSGGRVRAKQQNTSSADSIHSKVLL